ncbi:MAG: tryptophan synthase subunit alpha [Clostridiales bacterium]|nr:tryptophan synthase subunit alpha [Clostridiales bacterium]
MNNLKQVFDHGKAFIPFITAGDPSLEVTEQLVIAMAKAGADLIELGIPFSDPVAEGEVIQRSDLRALSMGVTTDKIFDMVARIRKACDVPIAFMTYMNPVFTYGTEKFMKRCQEVNIQALIVPDVPYEEREELLPYCEKYKVTFISMIAPTSSERIQMIAKQAQGFIYCVSSLGVTGMRDKIGDDVRKMIETVRQVSDIPCAVGFGVSTPEQAAAISKYADGVIVGSAIVKIIEEYGEDCIPHVVDYIKELKSNMK